MLQMAKSGMLSPTIKQTHIDIHDGTERAHWTAALGVTDERLRKAVRLVGTRVSSVSAYLAK